MNREDRYKLAQFAAELSHGYYGSDSEADGSAARGLLKLFPCISEIYDVACHVVAASTVARKLIHKLHSPDLNCSLAQEECNMWEDVGDDLSEVYSDIEDIGINVLELHWYDAITLIIDDKCYMYVMRKMQDHKQFTELLSSSRTALMKNYSHRTLEKELNRVRQTT